MSRSELTKWRRVRGCIVLALVCILYMESPPAAAQVKDCQDAPEGRICRIQQPVVNGGTVHPDLQRELGLVKVRGCSGTLLNRFWVLTADHCVTSDGKVGTTVSPLDNLTITAAWSTKRYTPSRVVRYIFSNALDVALLYLGDGDFGPVNIQLLFVGNVEPEMRLTKYGTGLYELASASGILAWPSKGDGQYRSARFTANRGDASSYTLPINEAGQVGAFGDSGGPDIVTADNGIGLGIAGVTSFGDVDYLWGKPQTDMWVSAIRSATSASIESIRSDIYQVIREAPSCLVPSTETYWISECADVTPLISYLLHTVGP